MKYYEVPTGNIIFDLNIFINYTRKAENGFRVGTKKHTMGNLNIKVTFIGGSAGWIRFKIFSDTSDPVIVTFSADGEQTVALDAGLHLISVTGVNTPGGMLVEMDKPTTPSTPNTITMNPIFSGYSVTIN